jgi:hypothetical protein
LTLTPRSGLFPSFQAFLSPCPAGAKGPVPATHFMRPFTPFPEGRLLISLRPSFSVDFLLNLTAKFPQLLDTMAPVIPAKRLVFTTPVEFGASFIDHQGAPAVD